MLYQLYTAYINFAWNLLAAAAVMVLAVTTRVAFHVAFGTGKLNIPLGFAVLQADVGED